MADTPSAIIPVPQDLYVHLSERKMNFARYELRREPYFAFSAFNLQRRMSLRANLKEVCATEAILQTPTRRVQVLVENGKPIAIPLTDFREEDCQKIYQYSIGSIEGRNIFYDIIAPAGIVLLFSVDKSVCKAMEDTFGTEVHYLSSLTPVVKHFTTKPLSGEFPTRLFIYLHETTADMLLLSENRPLCINSCFVQSSTDVAYYALGMLRNFVASPAEATIHIVADEAPQREAACTELKKYAPRVYAVHPSAEFHRNPVTMAEGITYDLVNLLLP
ncbi:MAG: DUF3822 family protein [Bacteroidaceae bacterium]|nr:DUF3822 family protein [Bacteroidaceae bacterium]